MFIVNILILVDFGFHSIAVTQYLFTRFSLLIIQSLIYCYISFDISHIELEKCHTLENAMMGNDDSCLLFTHYKAEGVTDI